MYLELWMMVTLVIAFGVCAWACTTSGYSAGSKDMLTLLYNSKIISLQGKKIVPYTGENK